LLLTTQVNLIKREIEHLWVKLIRHSNNIQNLMDNNNNLMDNNNKLMDNNNNIIDSNNKLILMHNCKEYNMILISRRI